ncbi:tryptophan synthase subunit alpha [Robiginitalea aurantiaca]|uniref:Tryptophan synthase alpha chain n=1 Tax=Robiginitalea aurantiaca TaxID=3056915 RepID=A0ABT7WHJ5_9FLAO|nr:tryptophan synthase subunit alpha [Robiginitalea aurantiaca]MDM9632377.1 tryptophan synthase subunit alpha [Robiginitalea aurantiaca]
MQIKENKKTDRIGVALKKEGPLLSIYFTAGYPHLEDTLPVLRELQKNGVDMIEIGLPFSDPLADGPTIQESSMAALKNGMTTHRLFDQLRDVRSEIHLPLILMGYFNPVLQFGVEAFCEKCREVGIDGLILPDLPLEIYQKQYRAIFEKYGLKMVFLITPQTSEARIRTIDRTSDAFIYMVSTASTTGAQQGFDPAAEDYFKRVSEMNLKNPQIVGFGISNAQTFGQATKHAKGAIIGSAFIKTLTAHGLSGISSFIKSVRP